MPDSLETPPSKSGAGPDRKTVKVLPGASRAPFPGHIEPMLAQLKRRPPSGGEWAFEPKLDGFRTLAYIRGGKVILRSRNDTDMTGYFPAIAADLVGREGPSMVLDGEIVAIDDRDKFCFQCLQQHIGLPHEHTTRSYSTFYYVFDVLYYGGFSLLWVAWRDRNGFLKQLQLDGKHLRLIEPYSGSGTDAYKTAVASGFEGIVAKKKESPYRAGLRSPEWQKIKSTLTDDFVIGGFKAGAGSRSNSFASLLLGYYEDGRLRYVGSVGSGFDGETLKRLSEMLSPLITPRSPFAEAIKYAEGVTWVNPRLVAEVKFAERTPAGFLRHAVFLRVRTDKPASQVTVHPATGPVPPSNGAVVLSKLTHHIIESMQSLDDQVRIRAGGHDILLTSLNKVFWPAYGGKKELTKRSYILYLAQMADFILKHTKDRPLTLTRYPDGIEDGRFYQKHWKHPLPEFVDTATIYSKENESFQEYLLCNNLATLMWLGQIADLEIHTWYSRVSARPDPPNVPYRGKPAYMGDYLAGIPDFLIFDVDPYIYSGEEQPGEEPRLNRKAFKAAVAVAFWLKEKLESMELVPFIKTSGKTGLHIFVPVERRYDYDRTRKAAAELSHMVEASHPDDITTEWRVDKRRGKVFLDYNQNSRGKTVASVYSARPTPWAGVSLPFTWEEIEKIFPGYFNILNAPRRLAGTGDVWADIMKFKRQLPASLLT
jgi:bifunctional non-homologous end joining protein LigD